MISTAHGMGVPEGTCETLISLNSTGVELLRFAFVSHLLSVDRAMLWV